MLLQKSHKHRLKRLRRSAIFRSPAHLLPAVATLLVILFSTISFFLPAFGSSGRTSPSNQLIASIHSLYVTLGVPCEDEFGLKNDSDPVSIEEGERSSGAKSIQKTAGKGETLSVILAAAGLSDKESRELERQVNLAHPAIILSPGTTYEIETNPDGSFSCISWRVDRHNLQHLEKDERTGKLSTWKEKLQSETKLATLAGKIPTTLSLEMSARNRPTLVEDIRNLLASKVDVAKNSLKGASYRILYEERWIGDEFVGTGKILAIEISSGRHSYNAYRFTDTKGGSGYYDERGVALQNAPKFMQPCNYDHVSSGFGYRIHPIRHTRSFHGGVDLAAPVGTPVRAVADGRVIFRGRNGGGGNMVTIAHGGGMHTQYLHLSRFSALGSFGSQVHQGEIIGYVGSTGLSTGPHLDFRVIQNDRLQNPLVVLQTPAPTRRLAPAELGGLLAKIDLYESQLNNSMLRVASIS